MIQQKQQNNPNISQSVVQQTSHNIPLTAQLFLFRQLIIDILNHCKKNIKAQPFEDMQVDKLVESNLTRSIDIYQQYFLIGIGTAKTRELVCHRYQRLVKENLINKDNLPPQMITGIINARSYTAGGGGSTASSGSNSVVGSALNFNTDKPLQVGKLVSTIISLTIQPSVQISAGLCYLLEGTRNKNNGNTFVQLLEQVYTNLSKNRKKPIDRFLINFIDGIVSQIQYHETSYIQYQKKYKKQLQKNKLKTNASQQTVSKYNKMPLIMREQSSDLQNIPNPPPMYQYIKPISNPLSKQRICIHPNQQDAKFGKCFNCARGANNYDKNMFVPLCSMDCKNKLRKINQQCIMNDHFNLLTWIIQVLSNGNFMCGAGDQVMYSLLLRQLSQVDTISQKQIGSVMEIVVNNFTMQAIGINNSSQNLQIIPNTLINKIIQNSSMIVSCLIRKYPRIMFQQSSQNQIQIKLEQNNQILPNFHNTKILLSEMTCLLQSLPIINNSLQLTILKSFIQILSSKQITGSKEPFIVLKQLYLNCDCRILETNLVQRIFNIISQYALAGVVNVNTSSPSPSLSNSQNLGTSTTINVQSMNAISLGAINNASLNTNGCNQVAISGLEQLLISIVKVMKHFDTIQNQQRTITEIIKQKKIKKYIQTKFVQDFNKKPLKAVDALRKMFSKITTKDIAIILKQNLDYETKIKKTFQKLSRQQVGTYFGTLKKQKNVVVDDHNQKVYWEFLKLLEHQYAQKQIDDCLRIIFNTFKIPKEGQQVQVVLGPLSLALEPYLGMKQGNEATATYQLVMVALMIQTSLTNPNIKQSQKLKFEQVKNFCLGVDKQFPQARMVSIYERFKKKPLEFYIQYKRSEIFTKKYLKLQNLRTQFWKSLQNPQIIQDKKQQQKLQNSSTISVGKQKTNKLSQASSNKIQKKKQQNKQSKQNPKLNQNNQMKLSQSFVSEERKVQQKQQQIIQSKNSIEIVQQQKLPVSKSKSQNLLTFLFQNIWQYIYMTTVNRHNLKGLEQCCIIYGKSQLLTQFQAFFIHLYKLFQDLSQRSSNTLQTIGNQAKLIILKLSIDYSNCVIGRLAWLIIIRIIYKLDIQQQDKNKNQSPRKGDNFYASYEYEASDKLFTRTNTFKSQRLKQFLQAMCQFSSSQVKTDKKYTREMYILHHIAEIIQYNLQRFQKMDQGIDQTTSLWQVLWPTIRSYFRNICVHPRKQISMSAIDSYKQLTMKMLKLSTCNQINHIQLMNVYLYVFQRSAAYIKDLIINILLNVVCKQMKSGWNQLYTILDLSDSQDKVIVMKVVARIIEDIGFNNAGNVLRLHQIVLKQLRAANQDMYEYILKKLWQICQHFNRLDIWLETLSKIKDIYKSTNNVTILLFMYKICNQSIILIDNIKQKQKQKQPSSPIQSFGKSVQNMQNIQNQLQQKYLQQANQDQNTIYKQIKQIQPDQAQKLIYFQVFSTQLYILQIKNIKLFCQCLSSFKELNLTVFFNNLGGDEQRTGFLALWEMFLAGNHSVYFCYFLHDFLTLVFRQLAILTQIFNNPNNQRPHQALIISSLQKTLLTKKKLLLWLIRVFNQTNKDEILQLCQQDSDLNKSFVQILTTSQQALSGSKTQLIQFYLSSKQYQEKSVKHLVFLKIFKNYYQSQDNYQNRIQYIDEKILEAVLESYEYAAQVNSKPLLRNFLWNNEFFKGHDYLPGLIKQQLRSLQIIVKYFNVSSSKGKVYQIIYRFLKTFIQKALLVFTKYSKPIKSANPIPQPPKPQPGKPQTVSSTQQPAIQAMNRIIGALYQDLGLWITNSQQILTSSLRKLTKQIQQLKQQNEYINNKNLWNICIELCKVTSSKNILKQSSLLMKELLDKMY